MTHGVLLEVGGACRLTASTLGRADSQNTRFCACEELSLVDSPIGSDEKFDKPGPLDTASPLAGAPRLRSSSDSVLQLHIQTNNAVQPRTYESKYAQNANGSPQSPTTKNDDALSLIFDPAPPVSMKRFVDTEQRNFMKSKRPACEPVVLYATLEMLIRYLLTENGKAYLDAFFLSYTDFTTPHEIFECLKKIVSLQNLVEDMSIIKAENGLLGLVRRCSIRSLETDVSDSFGSVDDCARKALVTYKSVDGTTVDNKALYSRLGLVEADIHSANAKIESFIAFWLTNDYFPQAASLETLCELKSLLRTIGKPECPAFENKIQNRNCLHIVGLSLPETELQHIESKTFKADSSSESDNHSEPGFGVQPGLETEKIRESACDPCYDKNKPSFRKALKTFGLNKGEDFHGYLDIRHKLNVKGTSSWYSKKYSAKRSRRFGLLGPYRERQVAVQLTSILFDVYEKISRRELASQTARANSIFVRRFIELFNTYSWWSVSWVLLGSEGEIGPFQEEISDRVARLLYILKVAEECRNLRNFHGFFGLMGGLCQPHLQWIWEFVKEKDKLKFDTLKRAVSPKNDYRVYKADLSKSSGKSCIPYLGLTTKMLWPLEKEMKAFSRNHPNLINFARSISIASTIDEFLMGQKFPYTKSLNFMFFRNGENAYNSKKNVRLRRILDQQIFSVKGGEELAEISREQKGRISNQLMVTLENSGFL